MLKWSNLLTLEEELDYSLNRAVEDEGILLYDPERGGYVPNPGGQATAWREALGGFTPECKPSSHRWVVLGGGVGSGKSFLGAVWIVHKALKHPNARFLISANSYPQLAQATLTTLAEVCMKYNIPLDPMLETPERTALAIANRRPAHCYIGPGRAYCYVLSMSSFQGKTQTSRGLGCRAAWLDEAAYASEEAFNTLDGRLGRGPGKELEGCGIITTTPNGLNWVWSRAFDPSRSDAFKKTFTFFNCPTRENLEHLGDGYVTSLEGNYDGELAQQELMGAFLNTASGLVYRKFSRNAHGLRGADAKCIGYDNTLRLHLCYDFNFTPAVCSAFHVRMNEVHCFKEWYVKESDVWELSEDIRDWLIKNKHQAEIWLHGDASGRARSASSRLSAWDIIWDTMKSGGFQMFKKYPASNPPVANRVDAFNFLCKQDRFFIDVDNCPELVKDFENVTWDGDNIDKSDILRTHLADSITYGVHFLYPYGGRNGPEKGSKAIPGFSV